MTLYTEHSRLCDIVFENPGIINVINRFGIFLGVSDDNVKTVCERHEIAPEFFLTIINTFLFPDYFPEEKLKSFSLPKITEYLHKTDNYYRQFQLPNIERHFNSLVQMSKNDNASLTMLRKFFMEMKQEFSIRIEYDIKTLFPSLKESEPEISEEEASYILQTDENIEDKLHDLVSFFVIHLKGEYDCNLCFAVVSALFALENDVKQNNRIRHRILLPMIKK